jgi:hypothetical protein
LINFLECPLNIPRDETVQGEAKEEAIQRVKRMVGLPLDDPKSTATTSASNRSTDNAQHITASTDRSLKSASINKTRSGRITKLPSSKKAAAKTSTRTAM